MTLIVTTVEWHTDGELTRTRCPECKRSLSIQRRVVIEPVDMRRKFCPKCRTAWACDFYADGTAEFIGFVGGVIAL